MGLRVGPRRALARGAAELRGGAGAGARRRGGARAAVARRGAAPAQRVQAARAPLGLRRGRLVLAAPPRALPAGRARAARRRRRARVHFLTRPRASRTARARVCLVKRTTFAARDRGRAAAIGPPRLASVRILEFTKFWKI